MRFVAPLTRFVGDPITVFVAVAIRPLPGTRLLTDPTAPVAVLTAVFTRFVAAFNPVNGFASFVAELNRLLAAVRFVPAWATFVAVFTAELIRFVAAVRFVAAPARLVAVLIKFVPTLVIGFVAPPLTAVLTTFVAVLVTVLVAVLTVFCNVFVTVPIGFVDPPTYDSHNNDQDLSRRLQSRKHKLTKGLQ
jgi:hypothetical protein